MPNYYEILNVVKDATSEDIKKSYIKLALEFHPDRVASAMRRENSDVTSAEIEAKQALVTEQFKLIAEAHATLSDPEKRTQYDGQLNGEVLSEPTADFFNHDFFNDAFCASMFANIAPGHHVEATSVQTLITTIDDKLQKIIDKAQYDFRYTKVAKVISDLKEEIATSKNDRLKDLSNQRTVKNSDFIKFLTDSIDAIKKAKNTKEPETHRGLFRGTPILKELTMLVEALLRLVAFVAHKAYKYATNDDTPVYSEGLYQGLFKPSPTNTTTLLNKIEKKLVQEEQTSKVHENLGYGSSSKRGFFSSFDRW